LQPSGFEERLAAEDEIVESVFESLDCSLVAGWGYFGLGGAINHRRTHVRSA
jgi:hypothetical protein